MSVRLAGKIISAGGSSDTSNLVKIEEFNERMTTIAAMIEALMNQDTALEERVASLETEVTGVSSQLDDINGEIV